MCAKAQQQAMEGTCWFVMRAFPQNQPVIKMARESYLDMHVAV